MKTDDLILATADFINRTPEDYDTPLIGVLEPYTKELQDAHVPRVGRGKDPLADGIMRNPGSLCTVRAINESREHPVKVSILMAVAQGHPRLGEILINPKGADWDAIMSFGGEFKGYRFESNWRNLATSIYCSAPPYLRTAEAAQVFATTIGAPELPAAYAANILARVTAIDHGDHMQRTTPGPVGAAHDLGMGLEHLTYRIAQLVDYPCLFDASAAACEIYRVNRHLKGKANLATKRPREDRVARFGKVHDWHKAVEKVMIA